MDEFKSNLQSNYRIQQAFIKKMDKEQMLITMPYFTIKHETLVLIRSIRGEKKSGLGLSRPKSSYVDQNNPKCVSMP